MKFSAKEDIEAPIEDVFEMLSDFESYERAAIRRGAEVQRKDTKPVPGTGMQWDIAFSLRGKHRQMEMEVVEYDRPKCISVDATSPSLDSHFTIHVVSLSKSRTRVAVELELKPKNLSARLLVQSLKLAKTNLTKRFKLRVAEYARELEDRYQPAA